RGGSPPRGVPISQPSLRQGVESSRNATVPRRSGAAERLVDRVFQRFGAQLGPRRGQSLLIDVHQALGHTPEYITTIHWISCGPWAAGIEQMSSHAVTSSVRKWGGRRYGVRCCRVRKWSR